MGRNVRKVEVLLVRLRMSDRRRLVSSNKRKRDLLKGRGKVRKSLRTLLGEEFELLLRIDIVTNGGRRRHVVDSRAEEVDAPHVAPLAH